MTKTELNQKIADIKDHLFSNEVEKALQLISELQEQLKSADISTQ